MLYVIVDPVRDRVVSELVADVIKNIALVSSLIEKDIRKVGEYGDLDVLTNIRTGLLDEGYFERLDSQLAIYDFVSSYRYIKRLREYSDALAAISGVWSEYSSFIYNKLEQMEIALNIIDDLLDKIITEYNSDNALDIYEEIGK